MRRILIVLVTAAGALIASAPALATAASPSLATRARHHLDRYFAQHPVHPSDGGSRSLRSCPVGSLGYAQRALQYVVSKDKRTGLTGCYALWQPADASYWVNVTYASKIVRPTWTSCRTYAKTMTTHVLRTVAGIPAK